MPDCSRDPRFARRLLPLLTLAPLLVGCGSARSAPLPDGFTDETVISSNTAAPVGIAFLPDGRLIVIEQNSANVLLLRHTGTPQLDLIGQVPAVRSGNTERGLLGVAVDPGWPGRPYLYTHSTSTTAKVRISRFKASGALSDPTGLISIDAASRYDLIADIPDNSSNHNGGTVRFGHDGRLYVTLGEDANPGASQDTSILGGKILRLDVSRLPDGPGSASRALITPPDNPLVAVGGLNARLLFAWGLRNPFRLQFDAQDGKLLIADVGETTIEEVDIVGPVGPYNFGWPHYEGTTVHFSSAPLTGPVTMPVYQIPHADAQAIIAACIYRRPAGATHGFAAEYEGDAFVSDYYTGIMRRLKFANGAWAIADPVPGQSSSENWGTGFDQVSDYAIGPEGALWYVNQAGSIHRVMSTTDTGVTHPSSSVLFAPPYPVPGAGPVAFDWALAAAAQTRLAILDMRGRLIRELVARGSAQAGPHHASWDAKDARGHAVRPGFYLAHLEVDGKSYDRKVPIVR